MRRAFMGGLLLLAAPLAAGEKEILVVDPGHAAMGAVFYVEGSKNTITFESKAPLEDIVGTSTALRGYLVFDPEHPEAGGAGRLLVPTASLETGLPLRDRHLLGKEWLDAESFPVIAFSVDSVRDVKLVKESEAFKTYDLVASGSLELHGKSDVVEVAARITYLSESEETRKKQPGNLLAVRAEFPVSLAAFGIEGFEGIVGSKVGETIAVSVNLIGTDREPE